MNAFPMMSRVPVPLSSSGGTSGPLTQDPSCGPVVQFVGCRVCGGVGWGKGGWLWSVILRGSSDVTHTHTQSTNQSRIRPGQEERRSGGVGNSPRNSGLDYQFDSSNPHGLLNSWPRSWIHLLETHLFPTKTGQAACRVR